MTRRIVAISVVLLVAFAAVIGTRTHRYSAAVSTSVEPMPAISIDIAKAVRRLSEAIQIQTISTAEGSPPSSDSIAAFHALLEREFPRVHAGLRRETINRGSLLYTWQGSDTSLLPALFIAHLDVVPIEPGTAELWTYPPFSGVIADGYVWGRGTIDMKQSLMSLLEAVEALLSVEYQPQRTILLAFGHDEEIGGREGAAELARTLQERGIEVEFVLDEGMAVTHGIVPGVERPAALIGIAEKGYGNFQLTARGAGGHTSNPPKRTAVGVLGRALARIEENPMPAKITDLANSMFKHLGPDLPLSTRVALANQWAFEPFVIKHLEATNAGNATVRTTIAPTILDGGVKANVVPQKATAILNVRLLPGDTAEDVIQHIVGVVNDPVVEIEQLSADVWKASPSLSDISSEAFGTIAASIRATFPDAAVAPGLVIGATDSRHYAAVARNTFRFLPIRLNSDDLVRFHGTDERISTEDYADSMRFYVDLMQRLTWNDVTAP